VETMQPFFRLSTPAEGRFSAETPREGMIAGSISVDREYQKDLQGQKRIYKDKEARSKWRRKRSGARGAGARSPMTSSSKSRPRSARRSGASSPPPSSW